MAKKYKLQGPFCFFAFCYSCILVQIELNYNGSVISGYAWHYGLYIHINIQVEQFHAMAGVIGNLRAEYVG